MCRSVNGGSARLVDQEYVRAMQAAGFDTEVTLFCGIWHMEQGPASFDGESRNRLTAHIPHRTLGHLHIQTKQNWRA